MVYDPDKTGEVTSAKQLFGHYTFGGKTKKVSDFKLSGLRSEWQNGYEALALLDTDSNAKISGNELNYLSLWFDKNRDGQVQKGELLSLAEAGVTALYYKWDRQDPISGDLHASLGFERTVAGKTIRGRSVDWFSSTFASRQEALQALGAMFKNAQNRSVISASGGGQAARKEGSAAVGPLHFSPRKTENHSRDLSGYWLWWSKDEKDQNHPNVFAFEQSKDGSLQGYSVIETKLSENKSNLRSGMIMLPASGKVSGIEDGKVKLAMEIRDSSSGGLAKSEAELSPDGGVLSGKTIQTFIRGNDRNQPETATLNYEWVARKLDWHD